MNDQQTPTAYNNGVILSIKHVQQIEISESGTTTRDFETYLKEFAGMIESGLMARMSNAAFKVLHALGLRACVLADPLLSDG
jgi:hypothetical protein